MDNQIYFVSFYTAGERGCLDLSKIASEVVKKVQKNFTKVYIYNPTTIKELPDSDWVCDVYPDKHEYFFNGHLMGYYDWKCFVIKNTLSQIPENSILLYNDINFDKYTGYWYNDWETIYETCNKFLEVNNSDIFVKFELFDFYVKNFVKTYTVDKLFPDPVENRIVKNSYELSAGQVILRNTPFARKFIDEWVEMCKDKTLTGPVPNSNPHPESKTPGCLDQDAMNCIIYRYILDGKLNPDFPKFGLHWRSITFDKKKFMKDGMLCETGPYQLFNTELIEYLKYKNNEKIF